MDWAISRNDPVRDIENIGDQVARMDRDMEQIHQQIQSLQRSRFDVKNLVPIPGEKSLR